MNVSTCHIQETLSEIPKHELVGIHSLNVHRPSNRGMTKQSEENIKSLIKNTHPQGKGMGHDRRVTATPTKSNLQVANIPNNMALNVVEVVDRTGPSIISIDSPQMTSSVNNIEILSPKVTGRGDATSPDPVFIAQPFGTLEGTKASEECESLILQQIARNKDGGYDISTNIRDVENATVVIKCDQTSSGELTMEVVCGTNGSKCTNDNESNSPPDNVFDYDSGCPANSVTDIFATQQRKERKGEENDDNAPGGYENGQSNVNLNIKENCVRNPPSLKAQEEAPRIKDKHSVYDGSDSVNFCMSNNNTASYNVLNNQTQSLYSCGQWSVDHNNMPSIDDTALSGNSNTFQNTDLSETILDTEKVKYNQEECNGMTEENYGEGSVNNGTLEQAYEDNTKQNQRRMSACCDNAQGNIDEENDDSFRKCSSMYACPQGREESNEHQCQSEASGIFRFFSNIRDMCSGSSFNVPVLPMYDNTDYESSGECEMGMVNEDEYMDFVENENQNVNYKDSTMERVLFYGFHGNNYQHYRTVYHPIFRHTEGCTVTPQELGFDCQESLNNSLNAKSEIIVRPPVCLGGPVFFRANVANSILFSQSFISNTVFQINWYQNSLLRRRTPSCWGC
eukprot:XP_001610781.1 hypothetical protein [Babesia bovis T2Bo]